jgi:hypothetical protein
LQADFAELDRLSKENPHPGDGRKVDNIAEAKNQQKELRDYIEKGKRYFLRIPPVPDVPKVTDHELSTALSHTIDQMRREATNASVILPPSYDFSFQAEKNLVSFSTNSLEPLAAQLGQVKAICDVLFQAKINELDSLQRERVCTEDEKGNQSDYLTGKTVTNELAVLTPYQVSFRCFSPELALVLSGFASSPYAVLVKTINVEHAVPTTTTTETTGVPPPIPQPAYVPPPPPTPKFQMPESGQSAFERRYGASMGGYRPPPPPEYARPTYPTPLAPAAPATVAPKSGLPVVLDESPLKVTIVLDVVKLTTPRETAPKVPAGRAITGAPANPQ